MAVNTGVLRAYDITAAATAAGEGTAPDQRRMYNFGSRVIQLNPNSSKFFTFLAALRKFPTDDPVFRYLQDRRRTAWTSREFFLAANVNSGSEITEGVAYAFSVDDNESSPASIDWLKNGDLFQVNTIYDTNGFGAVTVRIEGAVTDAGTTSTFQGKIIQVASGGIATSSTGVLSNNDRAQYVGNAFDEDAGAPDAVSETLGDNFGNCQYFKHSFEMTEIALATRYRGYPNEWNELWGLTLEEHKAALHRSMIMGPPKTTVSNIRYSDSLIGMLLDNGTWNTDDSALSYTASTPDLRSMVASEAIYDRFIQDLKITVY